MEVQEIKIDGVVYVPFGEKNSGCEGCALLNKACTIIPHEASVCDCFKHRRVKIKTETR